MTNDLNTTSEHIKRSDEIDLVHFFRNIGNSIVKFFKFLLKTILQFTIFSIRKFIYLISAIILGIVVSYSMSKFQTDFYISDLVLKSNAVENQELIFYINRLTNLTSEANYSVLANTLDISEEDAQCISNIKAFWFVDFFKDGLIDGPDYKDKYIRDTNVVKVNSKFGVRITVTDPTLFNRLTTGIIRYVESNEYFQSMNEMRLELLKEIIDQTELEIEKIDSLQKVEYFRTNEETRLNGGQLVFTNDPEVKLLHRDLLNLLRDKHRQQTEMEIHNEIVTIIENFITTQRPVNNILYYARKIIPLFIVIAYILAVFFFYRKEIIEVIRKG